MNKLTKGQRMCFRNGWRCDNIFPCRLASQAHRMGLKLVYKKKDLDGCHAFSQMIREGSL